MPNYLSGAGAASSNIALRSTNFKTKEKKMLPVKPTNQESIVLQNANQFKLEVARDLSKQITLSQRDSLLIQDALNKVNDLSTLEQEILKLNPQASQRTNFLIACFCASIAERLKGEY